MDHKNISAELVFFFSGSVSYLDGSSTFLGFGALMLNTTVRKEGRNEGRKQGLGSDVLFYIYILRKTICKTPIGMQIHLIKSFDNFCP